MNILSQNLDITSLHYILAYANMFYTFIPFTFIGLIVAILVTNTVLFTGRKHNRNISDYDVSPVHKRKVTEDGDRLSIDVRVVPGAYEGELFVYDHNSNAAGRSLRRLFLSPNTDYTITLDRFEQIRGVPKPGFIYPEMDLVRDLGTEVHIPVRTPGAFDKYRTTITRGSNLLHSRGRLLEVKEMDNGVNYVTIYKGDR